MFIESWPQVSHRSGGGVSAVQPLLDGFESLVVRRLSASLSTKGCWFKALFLSRSVSSKLNSS